jgi:hypothetical protein
VPSQLFFVSILEGWSKRDIDSKPVRGLQVKGIEVTRTKGVQVKSIEVNLVGQIEKFKSEE